MTVMNKFLFKVFFFFVLLFAVPAAAQNTLISKEEVTINGIKLFDLNMKTLIEAFGEPTSIEDYFFEMNNRQGKKILYEGLLIYVMDDEVKSIELTSQRYTFLKEEIRVFQSFYQFDEYFPESYANKKEGSLSLTLKEYDKYITFHLGKGQQNNRIVLIRMGDY